MINVINVQLIAKCAKNIEFKLYLEPSRVLVRQHKRVLREMRECSVLGKLTYALKETFKSSAIPDCLSESSLSHDVTRTLRY